MASITQRRRSVRRSSVRGYSLRDKVRTKPDSLARLKYSRILFLMALFLTVTWTVGAVIQLILPSSKPQSKTPNVTVSAAVTHDPKTVVYNVKTPPNLTPSKDLQTLVDGAVEIGKTQGLPTESLSISLIDVSNPNNHRIAGYNHTILRFPASVAKLYWMVAFFGYAEKGYIPKESPFYTDLSQMMRISDNDSASRIVDAITQTESGTNLEPTELKKWIEKRSQVNRFFDQSGFTGINLTTKNYPITGVGEAPIGRDLQLRENPPYSKGNLVTTDQTARLMYDIYTKQAISPLASTKMAYLLTRDLNPKAWRNIDANPIEGFLGESLPLDIYYGSKVGYTSRSRQEVAFVRTLNDKAIYILAVFGDDPAYAKNEEVFPKISRYIFDGLNQTPLKSSPEKVTQLDSLPTVGIEH
ncbi:MAG: serine hydrolase [Planktothrix sp.]|uniref:serine hydrolase n=1 Tax=Planktothrix sp. TaxID=3088171 RepID=UPI0038D4D00F